MKVDYLAQFVPVCKTQASVVFIFGFVLVMGFSFFREIFFLFLGRVVLDGPCGHVLYYGHFRRIKGVQNVDFV